jgi:transposase
MSARRYELTDFEWSIIKPLLLYKPRGWLAQMTAERFFNKLKNFRAIATRFEKHDANYLALVKMAAVRIWMRFYESVT